MQHSQSNITPKLHPLEEHIYPGPSTQSLNHTQPVAEGAGIL